MEGRGLEVGGGVGQLDINRLFSSVKVGRRVRMDACIDRPHQQKSHQGAVGMRAVARRRR